MVTWRNLILPLLIVAASLGSVRPASAQARIDIAPDPVILAGEPFSIKLRGLPSSSEIEVITERAYGDPRSLYRASNLFMTNAAGEVDLAAVAPVRGAYVRPSPAAIFWSMSKVEGPAPDLRDGAVRIRVRLDGRELAEAEVTLRQSDPSLVVQRFAGFPGAIIARPAAAGMPLPVIIALGGSEGGTESAYSLARRLATHGYAVVGLPYYVPAFSPDYSKLPSLPHSFVDIPVERLEQVYRELRKRTDVDTRRLALIGVSKGAELSLLAATEFDWVRAVAAIAPSDVVWEGFGPESLPRGSHSSFAFKGKPYAFVPYEGLGKGTLREAHDRGRRAHAGRAARARIPIERFRGQLFVAGSWADRVWPSGPMAQNIVERRAEAGRPTSSAIFENAGHNLMRNALDPAVTIVGGTAEANADAQAATWRALLEFLARALGPRG